MRLMILLTMFNNVVSLDQNEIKMSVEYFLAKDVKYVCYFTCDDQYQITRAAKTFMENNMRLTTTRVKDSHVDLVRSLRQWDAGVGALLDGTCDHSHFIVLQASKYKLFDDQRAWLVLTRENDTVPYIYRRFQQLNLSINADIVVVGINGDDYTLTDVFNYGKIQGNDLEIASLGSWNLSYGLSHGLKAFKYYRRWDFHNLTLRAVSVEISEVKHAFTYLLNNGVLENITSLHNTRFKMVDELEQFRPELLSDDGYTPGIAAMTKITSQLLNLLKETHHFRYDSQFLTLLRIPGEVRFHHRPYLNLEPWNLAVTNSLFWEEQDISSTCARIFPQWLNWVDICFPPTTNLQTKFYYLIPDKGVGEYENQFVTPMSGGVWWCTLAACGACGVVLAAAAWLEARDHPGMYAFFSVYAAICQQDFEDGEQDTDKRFESQGRKITLLVVGITSMLLYNYYTSSVVSWLLNAATPTIDNLDGLISSQLELVFEDIGYSRQWLDVKPGFSYYYSGFVNNKEDELREKKVTMAKRTVNILQPIDAGMELVRSGAYAYHTEPYTARQVIARTFHEDEVCALGALEMMRPANVYVMVQRRSPYRQFFVWSLMRLAERGHVTASRRRFSGGMPACSGRRPRALPLGQAAPAFALLLQLTALSALVLGAERLCFKYQHSIRADKASVIRSQA